MKTNWTSGLQVVECMVVSKSARQWRGIGWDFRTYIRIFSHHNTVTNLKRRVNMGWDAIPGCHAADTLDKILHPNRLQAHADLGHTSNSQKTPIPGPHGRAMACIRGLFAEK